MNINDNPEIVGRITPENIITLNENEIFVFGSNKSGLHGAGSAKIAFRNFGAEWGVGIGITGECYAIPTKDYGIKRTLTINEIKPYVDNFISMTEEYPDFTFLVTKIGCGLAGYTPNQIGVLFKNCVNLKNVHLPIEFWEIL